MNKNYFREHLAREYDLPPQEAEELLEDARNTLKPLLKNIGECLKEKNWKDLSQKAHQLKGILGYLGLQELRENARVLEKLAGTEQSACLSYWEENVSPALKEVLEQIDIP
ncbi:MAG TPA: Hpt domain-containing protein [Synergistaceae bacterium]|nr:Hpt domain-containing protein [Synergistaceae bacterium]HPJ25656.1 Hpt domain-containing protein [Synergistaceae bacterium]HPQ37966.1 Hpt domain-containing protein [Synergistaceae bacterium]